MPAAAIIGSAAIGGVTSLIGASKQAGAARDAAETQAQAAQQAGELTQNAANQGVGDITTSMDTAGQLLRGNTEQANDLLRSLYEQYMPLLQPYQQAGAGAVSGLQQLASGQMQFGAGDPSYDWRLREGQKVLERSMVGKNLGGAAAKAALRYGQGFASTEYGNEFQRRFTANNALMGAGMNANDQALRAGTFYGGQASGNMMDSGRGQASLVMGGGNDIANLRMRGAEGYGNALTGGAAARAAGQVGASNAWAGGLSGVGNSAQNALMLYLLAGSGKKSNPSGQVPVVSYDPYGSD